MECRRWEPCCPRPPHPAAFSIRQHHLFVHHPGFSHRQPECSRPQPDFSGWHWVISREPSKRWHGQPGLAFSPRRFVLSPPLFTPAPPLSASSPRRLTSSPPRFVCSPRMFTSSPPLFASSPRVFASSPRVFASYYEGTRHEFHELARISRPISFPNSCKFVQFVSSPSPNSCKFVPFVSSPSPFPLSY